MTPTQTAERLLDLPELLFLMELPPDSNGPEDMEEVDVTPADLTSLAREYLALREAANRAEAILKELLTADWQGEYFADEILGLQNQAKNYFREKLREIEKL